MNYDEAVDLLNKHYEMEEYSCNCYINPPCSKCVNTLDKDTLEEALRVESEHQKKEQ